jgi:hypothetical protein
MPADAAGAAVPGGARRVPPRGTTSSAGNGAAQRSNAMATASAEPGNDYRLSRDDGVRLVVNGSDWEAALELAYLYGWHPAGTGTPPTDAWRNRRAGSSALLVWDSKDYFSRHDQHVDQRDARAIAQALQRALVHIEQPGDPRGAGARPHPQASPMPSRAAARAEGLTTSRRNAIGKLAAFAIEGGFTIAG